jgi:basic membrane protein A
MHRTRRVSLAVVAVLGGALTAGCGGDEKSATAGGQKADVKKDAVTIGMALPGPINDRGYNQGLYSGLQEAAKQGAKTSHVENLHDPTAALDAIKNLARANELVIIAGGQFTDIAVTAAKADADTKFILIDGAPKTPVPNLFPYRVNYRENGYLAGVAATKLTKSKKVAFVGGLDIPPVQLSEVGFLAGVAAAGGVKATKASTGSFNDAGAAKETSSAQIASGADVIFPFVDAAYTGTTAAASEAGKDIAVIVSNRSASVCDESPTIIGATTVKYPEIVSIIVKAFEDGTLVTDPQMLGVAQDIVSVELCPGRSDDAVAQELTKTAAGIKDGSITVPQG